MDGALEDVGCSLEKKIMWVCFLTAIHLWVEPDPLPHLPSTLFVGTNTEQTISLSVQLLKCYEYKSYTVV